MERDNTQIPQIASTPHDHQACIASALEIASQRCKEQGVRLTPLRKQVLELVWQSHKPLGAYELMEMLSGSNQKRIAPPTIYRALDFLLNQGLIHRITSLNAFTGCCASDPHSNSAFFICQNCQIAIEMDQQTLQGAIDNSAHQAGFSVASAALEVVGLCRNCQEPAS